MLAPQPRHAREPLKVGRLKLEHLWEVVLHIAHRHLALDSGHLSQEAKISVDLKSRTR